MSTDLLIRETDRTTTSPSFSRHVLAKDLRERAVPTLGIGAALFSFAMFALGIYSGLSEQLDQLTENMPEEMLSFIGGDAPGGYVVGETFDLLAPLVLVAYAIMSSASALAGEEESGTMGLLAAQPVARRSILAAKVIGLLLAVVAIGAMFFGGTALAASIFDIPLETVNVLAACVHLVFLAAAFGAIAIAIGAATGKPGPAAAGAGGLAVLSYLTASMLPLADLDGWARISPWYYYNGGDPLTSGIDGLHLLVLSAITGIALVLAFRAFDRRDLRS